MNLDQLFHHWEQIHHDTLATISKFSDADLQFQPYPNAWCAGQVMLHIADAEVFWLDSVIMNAPEAGADVYTLANYPSTALIKALLGGVHRRTAEILASFTLDDLQQTRIYRDKRLPLNWIIWHVVEHEIHHRAELSLMLGMMGRTGLDV